MIKNEKIVVEQNQSDPSTLKTSMKPSMSRTLVYRTNKEFDKCTELLRNILTVQESRRSSKSSTIGETNRKSQQSSPSTNRTKKSNKKLSTPKSLTKTSLNSNGDNVERRSSYSPSKSLVSSTEDSTLIKSRSSPNKTRKHSTRSPSPTVNLHQRHCSPSKSSSSMPIKVRQKSCQTPPVRSFPIRQQRSQNNKINVEIVRSSSCGDIPSNKIKIKEENRLIRDQFVDHLNRIRNISKQIRNRQMPNNNDVESFRLWTDLENCLSSALSFAQQDVQFDISVQPLREEISQLRKQLRTTNDHLREFDQRRNEENFHPRKFDTNCPTYSQLFNENQDLKIQFSSLQEKIESLEKTNLRLIQRSTQKDLRLLAEPVEQSSNENCFLLREEILSLKQKLYHLYDDLASLFNRNRSLELSNSEQKQEIFFYKQQIAEIQQSAEEILREIDKRSTEEKIRRFLNEIVVELHQNGTNSTINHYRQGHTTPTKTNQIATNSSCYFFETPHKGAVSCSNLLSSETNPSRRNPSIVSATKLRPKSLFITPTILNDATALSKLKQNRNFKAAPNLFNSSSSSTICDAESIRTSSSSSLCQNQIKRTTLYNSLPTLNLPVTNDSFINGSTPVLYHRTFFEVNPNESGPEMDQISDLTSKMFSSSEEDIGIGGSSTPISSSSSSSSSSTIPIDPQRATQM